MSVVAVHRQGMLFRQLVGGRVARCRIKNTLQPWQSLFSKSQFQQDPGGFDPQLQVGRVAQCILGQLFHLGQFAANAGSLFKIPPGLLGLVQRAQHNTQFVAGVRVVRFASYGFLQQPGRRPRRPRPTQPAIRRTPFTSAHGMRPGRRMLRSANLTIDFQHSSG